MTDSHRSKPILGHLRSKFRIRQYNLPKLKSEDPLLKEEIFMANCPMCHDAAKIKEALVTINQEPTKDDTTDPVTYTFPVGAITKISGYSTAELDRNVNKQLGIVAACIALCGALIGAGIACLAKN